MKTNNAKHIVAIALFAFAGVAFAQAEPPVRVKTDGLPLQVKQRIEEKAQQGQTALIRYLNNTRYIHQLRVEEVVISEPPAAMAKSSEATKIAKKEEPAK